MQKKILPANEFQIKSAGIETHGLNLNAVKVMAEDGVDISSHYSKLIDLNYLNTSDLVITLCGDAKDKCPMPRLYTGLYLTKRKPQEL